MIPAGTIISTDYQSNNVRFITTTDAVISENNTESKAVKAIAEDFGLNYIVAADTVTKIIDSDLAESFTVNNSDKSHGGSYADYFRLFEKQPFGSFTVIAHFEGYTASGVFGLAAGEDDPNIETQEELPPQPRYGNYGYYDKSYLSGVPVGFAKDVYEDLLDYLRAQGVKAYLDIVIKDYIENDAL